MISDRIAANRDPRDLIEISRVYNYDGAHTKRVVIGYLKEYLPVLLTEWIDKYYIVEVDDIELYPMSYVGYPYALALNKIDHCMENVPIYCDIDDFKTTYLNSLYKTKIIPENDKWNQDYQDRLKMVTNIDIVRFAIENKELLDDNKEFAEAADNGNVLPLLNKISIYLENNYTEGNRMIAQRALDKGIMNSIIHERMR